MKREHLITIAIVVIILLPIPSVGFAETVALTIGWIQVNSNGFGDAKNSIQSLEVFNEQLYAGTWSNEEGHAAQIWRSADGKSWGQVTPSWAVTNQVVLDMQTFKNNLYIGIGKFNDDGGEVWRSSNGTTWEQVVGGGFGDTNNGIRAFAVFLDSIFTATANFAETGIEVWSSATGNSDDWNQVNNDGFGGGATSQDSVMDVFGDYLYVGFGRQGSGTAELWRYDGTDWTSVFTNGLGDSNNTHVSAMEEFNGYFYIGLRNTTTGGEVWRSINGTDWNIVFTGGYGDSDNNRPYGLTAFNNRLYLVMNNKSTGPEVWESIDGLSWKVIADNGWGVPDNVYADYFDNGNAIFKGGLYISTLNRTVGGQIWLYLHEKIYLPLAIR